MANEGNPVIGDYSVPDFFIDEAVLFDRVADTIRITLASVRNEKPVEGSPKAYVAIGTLIMSIGSAQRLSAMLHAFLEQQGLSPSDAVRGGQTAQ